MVCKFSQIKYSLILVSDPSLFTYDPGGSLMIPYTMVKTFARIIFSRQTLLS